MIDWSRATMPKHVLHLGGYLVALCLLLLTGYIILGFEFIQIEGQSMSPTLPDGSIVLVDKLSPYWRHLEVGDIVVVRSKPQELVVKRIALDRSTKLSWNEQHALYVPMLTNYIELEPLIEQQLTQMQQLSKHELFILGDNQPISYDSRSYGVVHRQQIIGKVIGINHQVEMAKSPGNSPL